jgi:uncharacterized lipoprotein YajG
MRYLIALLLLAACAQQPQPAPQTVYVTRTVKDCSWIPTGTYSVDDTQQTREWMIAYEKARQANCHS